MGWDSERLSNLPKDTKLFLQQNQEKNPGPQGSSVCTFNLFVVCVTRPESDRPLGVDPQLCLKLSKDK